MRRRLLNFAAFVSAVLCVATAALWVRSVGHFEDVDIRYARWPRGAEGRCGYIEFAWYSNTLRLYVINWKFAPDIRNNHPPGWQWRFCGDFETTFRIDYDPGFQFRHHTHVYDPPDPGWGSSETLWMLGVRPWLPTLLLAALPAMWMRRFLKMRRRRREGLCRTCGYDLRATPERCPECGAVPREPPHNPPLERTAAASSGAVE